MKIYVRLNCKASALLFFYMHYTIKVNLWKGMIQMTITILRYLILTAILIPIIFIDIKKHIIPNSLNLIGAVVAIILILFDRTNYSTHLWGGLFGLGLLIIIILASEFILKKQGMGEGDAKLMGVIGLFLGLPNTVLTAFLSFVLGSVFGVIAMALNKLKPGEEMPFGPFIAIGAMISMLCGDYIIAWYLGF